MDAGKGEAAQNKALTCSSLERTHTHIHAHAHAHAHAYTRTSHEPARTCAHTHAHAHKGNLDLWCAARKDKLGFLSVFELLGGFSRAFVRFFLSRQ